MRAVDLLQRATKWRREEGKTTTSRQREVRSVDVSEEKSGRSRPGQDYRVSARFAAERRGVKMHDSVVRISVICLMVRSPTTKVMEVSTIRYE